LGFMSSGLAPSVVGLVGIHVVWIGTECRRASSYRRLEGNVGPSSPDVVLYGLFES